MNPFPTEELIRLLLARALYWPILIAFVVVTLLRWRRHPTAAFWAMLGLCVLLVGSAGRVAFYTVMTWLAPAELTIPDNGFFNLATVAAGAWATLDGMGIALILLGVFSERQRFDERDQAEMAG